MIQAKELRIGNYVGFGDNLCAVCEIQKEVFYVEDFISSEEYKSSWADLKPITLTEEWLLKLGFDKENGYIFVFPNNSSLRMWGFSWNVQQFLYNGSWVDITMNYSVKYVHQLQNLYFSLIGEELEINL